jgi:hypothetical protein
MLLSLLVLRVVSLSHTGSGFVPMVVGPKGSEGQLVAHWWMPLPELGRNYNYTLSERLALISALNSNWNTTSSLLFRDAVAFQRAVFQLHRQGPSLGD